MEELFLSVLNMSLTASYVVLFIMLVRLPLKKAPKTISYALWAVAGFRLVFPFSLESVFSLIPFKSAPIPADITTQPIPRVNSGINIVDNAVSQILPAATPTVSVNPLQIWLTVGAYLWLAGIAVMLIYSVVSIVLLKRHLRGATHVEDNIYEAGNLKTPFVLGLLRPKIYIPAGLTEEEKRYIILHERTHIRRHDHVVKFLAYFILCLHWFNPLVWAAFLLMGADMEMSCDERVLKEIGFDTKKAYSMSLLSLAAERRIIGGSPLAFGEGGMKERIKNVLNFKKPSRVIITVAVALVAVLSVGFAMDRIDVANPSTWEIYHFPSYAYDRVTFNTDAVTYLPSFKAITAELTNREMESGLKCGKAFTLVKQVGKNWRIVPFTEGRIFIDIAMNLSVGDSETYTLTPDMLSGKLDTGNYRIVTDVWYTNETAPRTIHKVWADFTVSEREAEITLDKVRELARNGDALTMEDFKDFKGVDTSSNPGYHIMEYSVEGGYCLIVETDGERLNNVNLESIWLSSAGVVDIRYNDIDEFVKSHPSSADGIIEDPEKIIADIETEFLESGDPAYALGANKNGRPVFVNPDSALEAALRDYAKGFVAVSEKFNLDPVNDDNCSLYKKYGWQQPYKDLKYQGIQISKFFDIYENSISNGNDTDEFIKPSSAAIEVIRQSDKEKWTLSDKDIIDKFTKALNNRQKTNSKIDIRPHDYSVKIYFTDKSSEEYRLWVDEDINVRGVLMNGDTTWFINKASNPIFKEIIKEAEAIVKVVKNHPEFPDRAGLKEVIEEIGGPKGNMMSPLKK